MIVRWLDAAVKDLHSLRCYIAQDNPVAAGKTVKKILDMVDMLSEHPGIGRQGRVAQTRELIVAGTSYLIPYQVKHNVIEILRVFHCAIQWPEDF